MAGKLKKIVYFSPLWIPFLLAGYAAGDYCEQAHLKWRENKQAVAEAIQAGETPPQLTFPPHFLTCIDNFWSMFIVHRHSKSTIFLYVFALCLFVDIKTRKWRGNPKKIDIWVVIIQIFAINIFMIAR